MNTFILLILEYVSILMDFIIMRITIIKWIHILKLSFHESSAYISLIAPS